MAEVGEGPWFNQLSGQYETVTGVWCTCYECRHFRDGITETDPNGYFWTKNEYREHQNERRQAYYAWKRLKAAKDGKARTKEKTEAEAVWEGRPVPTFFDINGDWLSPDTPSDQYLHSRYLRRMD